jgi:hypothetical protein
MTKPRVLVLGCASTTHHGRGPQVRQDRGRADASIAQSALRVWQHASGFAFGVRGSGR